MDPIRPPCVPRKVECPSSHFPRKVECPSSHFPSSHFLRISWQKRAGDFPPPTASTVGPPGIGLVRQVPARISDKYQRGVGIGLHNHGGSCLPAKAGGMGKTDENNLAPFH
jgi:hypothetical protein